MKTLGNLFAIVLAFSATAAVAQSTSEMENWRWHNVLYLQPQAQNLNNLNFPTPTLRPYRGTHLKVTIPTSCGEIRYSGVVAYGRDQWNRRMTLDIKRIGQSFHRGAEEYYYVINNGQATVFELGISTYISNPWACNIAVEQANKYFDSDNTGDDCQQYLNAACPAVYDPAVCTAHDFSNNILMRKNSSNSCGAINSIKASLCQQRGLHEDKDYKISCRSSVRG